MQTVAETIQVPNLPAALEAGLAAMPDEWDDSVVHVSDLSVALEGEGCPRQLWLRLGGAKRKPLTAGQMLMFDHGHRIHERLVELIAQGLEPGWYIHSVETPVELPGPVTGRYDTVLEGPEDTMIVVDFKTLRGRAFGYLNEARPAHALQVQGYGFGTNASGGLVFYVDREGQNAARQFFIPRNDQAVEDALRIVLAIAGSDTCPPILEPRLLITRNKGPDSVKIAQPWQCDYCQYLDVSCKGALPKKQRELGIIGYIAADNVDFKPKKGCEKLCELVESLRTDRVPF